MKNTQALIPFGIGIFIGMIMTLLFILGVYAVRPWVASLLTLTGLFLWPGYSITLVAIHFFTPHNVSVKYWNSLYFPPIGAVIMVALLAIFM